MAYGLRMRNAVPPDRGDWATFVKSRREAVKMTGAELSRRLHIDRATLWRWESGRQRPENGEMVAAVAELFGADLDEALAAAGLRPAEVVQVEPDPPLDPLLAAILRILEDKNVPEDEKEYMRSTMRRMVERVESQQVQTPKRRARKVG
jgi:transcriptional regulator with XRE-family HTH domain